MANHLNKLALTILLIAAPAFANTAVTLTFTGVNNGRVNPVQTFYQKQFGATFSSSALIWNTALYNPGVPNSSFSFVDPADANCASSSNGNCTSLKMPFSNNVVLQGVLGGPRNLILNIANGITGFFSFQTDGSNNNSAVNFYSGPNGTGTLLRSIFIPASGKGVLKTWSNEIALDPTFRTQLFNVVAHSVVFDQGRGTNGSGSGYIEYDNLSFNLLPGGGVPAFGGAAFALASDPSAPAVPEPETLALLFTGMLAAVPALCGRRLTRRTGE